MDLSHRVGGAHPTLRFDIAKVWFEKNRRRQKQKCQLTDDLEPQVLRIFLPWSRTNADHFCAIPMYSRLCDLP